MDYTLLEQLRSFLLLLLPMFSLLLHQSSSPSDPDANADAAAIADDDIYYIYDIYFS
jgi:hypothetical protein